MTESSLDGQHKRVAAIDCGTNSLRLLIADIDPGHGTLADLRRRMEIVRLGQGVDATGRLAPEALARTFAMLGQYAEAIRESGAEAVRLVATSATRDASNADEFRAGVQRILGIEPEVATGSEEAYLSFSGATAELTHAAPAAGQPEPPFLVVDVGGGSTEFVLGTGAADGGAADLAAISTDIGCVRLTERHLHDDPPASAQIAAAEADIDAALDSAAACIPVGTARTLVGLAGSITTVTALALGLTDYNAERVHHARISASRLHEVAAALLSQNHQQRAAHRAIHPGRVDVIAAGALIADRIVHRFGFPELVASEHDILDGIAWSMVLGDTRTSARR
ncbi:MAG TPA: Ppx/GppA phosphatase family protein [Streptosporangiaceae bacterium]|nr:Ppx/GppA phosphatase family protein [Streptosporangiaceae bacterium]